MSRVHRTQSVRARFTNSS